MQRVDPTIDEIAKVTDWILQIRQELNQELSSDDKFLKELTAILRQMQPEPCGLAMDTRTGNYIQTCHICGFTVEGTRRPASYCANCGNRLVGEYDE